MARDPHAALFLCRRGQVVRWAERPGLAWRITGWRWTELDIMPPFAQYRLAPAQPDVAT